MVSSFPSPAAGERCTGTCQLSFFPPERKGLLTRMSNRDLGCFNCINFVILFAGIILIRSNVMLLICIFSLLPFFIQRLYACCTVLFVLYMHTMIRIVYNDGTEIKILAMLYMVCKVFNLFQNSRTSRYFSFLKSASSIYRYIH